MWANSRTPWYGLVSHRLLISQTFRIATNKEDIRQTLHLVDVASWRFYKDLAHLHLFLKKNLDVGKLVICKLRSMMGIDYFYVLFIFFLNLRILIGRWSFFEFVQMSKDPWMPTTFWIWPSKARSSLYRTYQWL